MLKIILPTNIRVILLFNHRCRPRRGTMLYSIHKEVPNGMPKMDNMAEVQGLEVAPENVLYKY